MDQLTSDEMVAALSVYLNAEVIEDPQTPGAYLWRTAGQTGDYGWQPVSREQMERAAEVEL